MTVALITGANSGIGRSAAVDLAAKGWTVYGSMRSLDKGEKLTAMCAAAGVEVTPEVCDVTDTESVNRAVAEVIAAEGRIDVLVNGAGVFYPTRIGETDEAMFDRMCDINLKGTFFTCNAVAQHMIARGGGGRMINFGSAAGVSGRSNYIVYSATKAGVIHMTRSFGVALAPHGINVNAVVPGNTATPMNENVRTEPGYAEIRETIARVTPSKRLFADADEIAGAVLFLASNDANAMYGTSMLMDEGATAGY